MPARRPPRDVPVVFISSTSKDLEECRRAVMDEAVRAGFHPEWMEHFPATGTPPLDECLKRAAAADLLIVLVGYRYGWIPDEDKGALKSITWLECEAAAAKKHQVLAFLVDPDADWPAEQKDSYRLVQAVESGKLTAKLSKAVERDIDELKRFKDWLNARAIRKTFTGPLDLRSEIGHALTHWRETNRRPARAPRKSTPAADPARYLAWLRETTGWIDIRGLQVGSGRANRVPIQDLYIPLQMQGGGLAAEKPRRGKAALRNQPGRVPLEIALKHRKLVIRGDPGSGKTTFLHRIAWELSSGQKDFPIFIRIADLHQHMEAKPAGAPLPHSPAWLPHYLARRAGEEGWNLTQAFFERKLKQPGTVVLLDGLDEAPDRAAREAIARLFENAVRAYDKARFAVTTRPGSYQGMATLAGFTEVTVADFDAPEIAGFLDHWTRFLYPTDPARAARHRDELSVALAGRVEIRRMARNPVMLTALAVVHWNERRLPEQRAELYESIVAWLARAREYPGREPWDRCLTLLGDLALGMQKVRGHAVQVSRDEAARILRDHFPAIAPKERYAHALRFLEREEVDSGIFKIDGSELRFSHLTFQEYLAARASAGLTDEDQKETLFEDGRLYKPEWRETMCLLGGILIRLGRGRVDGLFTAILERAEASPESRIRCVGLLGAMLRDLQAVGYQPADPRYRQFLDEALAVFKPESRHISLKTRIEAAEALGQAGDPRLHQNNWVTIPAGVFTMGADKTGPKADPDAFPEESPAHAVELPAYQIRRYPVTVEEYRVFVEDGGYRNAEFWKAGGFGEFTLPGWWDKQTDHPNWPVTGVSWFEAAAYCASKGWRLPNEAEWERAARGTEVRRFPWGDEQPDPSRANYGRPGFQGPNPVGLFPRGATPDEDPIYDLAGNVWEWVDDWFGPYPPASRRHEERASRLRVLRGGSWAGSLRDLRAAFRARHRPAEGDDDIGFRCARDFPA